MGVPSIGILLHEIIKLMYHAKCKDPVFIRIGTCGGIGIEGGTVVVSSEGVDGQLRNTYEMVCNMLDSNHANKLIETFLMLRLCLEKSFIDRPS